MIGHRYVEDCHLQNRLDAIVRELIGTHEYVEFMIDDSDALIAYFEHEGGGAARCLHMAEKREIEIIRL